MDFNFSAFIAVLLGLCCLKILVTAQRKKGIALSFSLLALLERPRFKLRLVFLANALFWFSLILLSFSLCDVFIWQFNQAGNEKLSIPRRGIAIYLLIDRSSSMVEPLQLNNGEKIAKIQYVKELTQQFIKERPNDLIGLIGFARRAEIVCPLTLDKEELISRLRGITPVEQDSDDGTAIGYAIFKTVNLILSTKHFAELLQEKKKPSYLIENQVIVLLTDGLQSPHPLDHGHPFRSIPPEEAIQYAEYNGIHLYYVGVDPVLAKDQFFHQLLSLQQAVEKTHGSFFLSSNEKPLDRIYQQIDTLEKSTLFSEQKKEHSDKQPCTSILLFSGLICLLIAISLETVIVRRTP